MSNTSSIAEWAEDFDGVWHRMSSVAWTKGVGPSDPVACCGRQIDSVSHSTFPPETLSDVGPDEICGGRAIDIIDGLRAENEHLKMLLEPMVQKLAAALVEQGYSTTRVECDAATLVTALTDEEVIGWPETPAFAPGLSSEPS